MEGLERERDFYFKLPVQQAIEVDPDWTGNGQAHSISLQKVARHRTSNTASDREAGGRVNQAYLL